MTGSSPGGAASGESAESAESTAVTGTGGSRRCARPSRRRLLAAVGSAAAATVGGCLGTDDEPRYERRAVNASGDPRSAEEMLAAEALAQTTSDASARRLGALALDAHEFVGEGAFGGPVVSGTATNDGSDRLQYVEVRVRIYDGSGAQLGRYLDSTGDLDAGGTWEFEVVLLASAADVAAYDIALLGIPS